MTHQLRFAARSDRGLLRQNNQDSVYAGERLLIVADGMGGHAAGDLASRVVVAAFTPLDNEPPAEDLFTPLRKAIHEGNAAIAEMVDEDPELEGMGTTATAMLFDGDRMALAHIGDSRAYLYRNGVLHQLSHDDTFVQSLVDDNRISEEEAAHHPQRNLLLRALNGVESEPALAIREISIGDRFLVCSDGLSSVVSAEAIADTLAEPDTDQAADRLIELALVGGGPDNVTVIVADVIDVGARAAHPVPGGAVDPDATGPFKPIHATQRLPRMVLPPEPERPSPAAGLGSLDGTDSPDGDDYDPDYDADYDGEYGDGDDVDTGRIEVVDSATPSKPWRKWVIIAAVVALLAGGLIAALAWAGRQYYVAIGDDGRVMVFSGVDGSVLGLSLNSPVEDSCQNAPGCIPIYAEDLVPAAREQAQAGITADNLESARAVVARLRGSLLPECPEPTETTATTETTSETSTGLTTPSTSGADATGTESAATSTGAQSTATRPTPAPRSRPGDRLHAPRALQSWLALDEPSPTASSTETPAATSTATPTASSTDNTGETTQSPDCRRRR